MSLAPDAPVAVHTADQGIIPGKFVVAWNDWSTDPDKPLIDALITEDVVYGSIPHVDHAGGSLPAWSFS